jgi:hypothetical protein
MAETERKVAAGRRYALTVGGWDGYHGIWQQACLSWKHAVSKVL